MKYLKKFTQSGFALLEVMIAAGLLGVIAFLFMHMGEQVATMDSRIRDMMDFNDLVSQSRMRMTDLSACTETFKPLFEQLKTNEVLTFPFSLTKVVGKYGNPLFEVGKKYGRLKINSIEVSFDSKSIPKKDFENEIGYIEITFRAKSHSKKSMEKVGKIILPAVISMPYTREKPYMVSCYSERAALAQDISNEVLQRTCASFGANYNVATGTCDTTGLTQFIGSPGSVPGNQPGTTPPPDMSPQKMQELQENALKMMHQLLKDQ